MDKKCLKVKIFLNFYGTYKELAQWEELYTTSCALFLLTRRKDFQCLGIGVSPTTFIRLPKLILFLVELLIL